jgi:hypothetical protein
MPSKISQQTFLFKWFSIKVPFSMCFFNDHVSAIHIFILSKSSGLQRKNPPSPYSAVLGGGLLVALFSPKPWVWWGLGIIITNRTAALDVDEIFVFYPYVSCILNGTVPRKWWWDIRQLGISLCLNHWNLRADQKGLIMLNFQGLYSPAFSWDCPVN